MTHTINQVVAKKRTQLEAEYRATLNAWEQLSNRYNELLEERNAWAKLIKKTSAYANANFPTLANVDGRVYIADCDVRLTGNADMDFLDFGDELNRCQTALTTCYDEVQAARTRCEMLQNKLTLMTVADVELLVGDE